MSRVPTKNFDPSKRQVDRRAATALRRPVSAYGMLDQQQRVIVRESLANLIAGRIDYFFELIDKVANGIPLLDAEGRQLTSNQGMPLYLSQPMPHKAVQALTELLEFVAPKLARVEETIISDQPVVQNNVQINVNSLAELKDRIAREIEGKCVTDDDV